MTARRPAGRTAKIAVIAGDGIGPEVIEAAIPILDRVAAKHGLSLAWERLPYSADHFLTTGETLPDAAFQHLRDDVDGIFLGALGDPRVPGNEHARDILLGLRFRLDLYVNFRPVELLHPDLSPLRLPADRPSDRPAIDFVIFRENTEGQYLGRGAAGATLHPGKPPGLFEPVHGSAPALTGQGVANPLAAVLTGGLLFEHLGHPAAAAQVKRAVRELLSSTIRPPDLGGSAGTKAVAKALSDLV